MKYNNKQPYFIYQALFGLILVAIALIVKLICDYLGIKL
jgi:hypothetical protein